MSSSVSLTWAHAPVKHATCVKTACSPLITCKVFSAASLAEALTAGLPNAGVSADTLAYVALHGTGTPLGDPIEVGALGQAAACGKGPDPAPCLTMGSVKSCYGHTEGAAGITGMLLAISALQQQVSIHPSIHIYIDLYIDTVVPHQKATEEVFRGQSSEVLWPSMKMAGFCTSFSVNPRYIVGCRLGYGTSVQIVNLMVHLLAICIFSTQ